MIKNTTSICPECYKVIDATIYEQEGKVYIKKSCPEHGEFSDLYWGTMNNTREQNIPDVIRCRVSKIWFKCDNMLNKMN